MKQIKLASELSYVLGLLLLSFSVAMVTAADLGVSMIVAPAYILSRKLEWLTFGQSEYVMQGILFIIFCIIMKKVKWVFFASFGTGILYGGLLDLWRKIIPAFNPKMTIPGSMAMGYRIFYFVLGMILTAFAIAFFFRTYLYPQVYDFFVKGISAYYKLNRERFKIGFDFSCLTLSIIMTMGLFGHLVGVGIGTLIMTIFNGLLIGLAGKVIDHLFVIEPLAVKLSKQFEISC